MYFLLCNKCLIHNLLCMRILITLTLWFNFLSVPKCKPRVKGSDVRHVFEITCEFYAELNFRLFARERLFILQVHMVRNAIEISAIGAFILVRFYAEFTCTRAWPTVHCPVHVTSACDMLARGHVHQSRANVVSLR